LSSPERGPSKTNVHINIVDIWFGHNSKEGNGQRTCRKLGKYFGGRGRRKDQKLANGIYPFKNKHKKTCLRHSATLVACGRWLARPPPLPSPAADGPLEAFAEVGEAEDWVVDGNGIKEGRNAEGERNKICGEFCCDNYIK
jgi:hypothetical protein